MQTYMNGFERSLVLCKSHEVLGMRYVCLKEGKEEESVSKSGSQQTVAKGSGPYLREGNG